MRTIMNLFVSALIILSVGCNTLGTNPVADPRFNRIAGNGVGDPGCEVSTLVSTGGPFPNSPKTLAIRWTGYSNFELVYNGKIILLDAYFDRGSMFPPLGFKAADIKQADLILIGHGHLDHMSDAASVGARTGALVAGAPVTTDKLKSQAIGPKQLRTVTGRGDGGYDRVFDHARQRFSDYLSRQRRAGHGLREGSDAADRTRGCCTRRRCGVIPEPSHG